MKRIIVLTLAAGLLSVATPTLVAQVSTNTPGQSESLKPTREQRQADRRKLMKILGLSGKELKGLPADERRTKIKDATDQKIAQLKQEKASGTITAGGEADLAFLESRPKHGKRKAKANADN
jgi:hypothetical protein